MLQETPETGPGAAARAATAPDITNIVFMGQGEPLDNLQAVLSSIDILTHPHGLQFSLRKVRSSAPPLRAACNLPQPCQDWHAGVGGRLLHRL